MSGLMKAIFGDNSAAKAAQEAKQIQAVANDRQLAELQRQENATAATRRAPRGQRLFEDGPALATRKLG
jgi:hypothetical protein